MITKIRSGALGPRRGAIYQNYYQNDGMITERTRRQLIEHIQSSFNDSEDEKEGKIAGLSELTESEAVDYLFQITRF